MNIKKIAAVAAAVVMAAGVCAGVPVGTDTSPLTVTAEAADSGFVIETDVNGDKYISKYTGNGTDITIPNNIKYVGALAFEKNETITSVTFPKSCVEIKTNAFAGLDTLKTVVFEGNAKIDNTAFRECENLENVTIKGSIKDYINDGAFNSCTSLKTFKINKNDYNFYIGNGAFLECHSLVSINIPDKCTNIGDDVFVNCFNLTNLTIPAKTKTGLDSSVGFYGFGDDYTGTHCFGYVSLKATENGEKNFFVADGKTSGFYHDYAAGRDTKVTPKQLTVYVTKGSPAEEYCKANGIKYSYGNAASAAANVPTNFKASKTTNSVTLSWGAVEGADMYRVYKYNEKTGKYEKYKDVKSAKCAITGLSANTKYKFKVTAYDKVDGKYVKGGTSKAVSVTTKK
ncbi:MAG: fibronectin type III domain-containing protein [Ruminococcus sp.]|nr:fibronectin type III domain-containing protein [Ruminococcus sp.]MCM1381020.1 fibronectin type III domain-containing protein [Muribaculaceae bacterium]MCM1479194.1 fibronectin type III domain-containing protein [Muribaculaceae bacterium]